MEANKLDASVAESTYVAKNDLPDFTSYLNKETADTLYATISQYNELSNSVSQLETNISNKIDKTELATINGQSLINGGDITISGGTE